MKSMHREKGKKETNKETNKESSETLFEEVIGLPILLSGHGLMRTIFIRKCFCVSCAKRLLLTVRSMRRRGLCG